MAQIPEAYLEQRAPQRRCCPFQRRRLSVQATGTGRLLVVFKGLTKVGVFGQCREPWLTYTVLQVIPLWS